MDKLELERILRSDPTDKECFLLLVQEAIKEFTLVMEGRITYKNRRVMPNIYAWLENAHKGYYTCVAGCLMLKIEAFEGIFAGRSRITDYPTAMFLSKVAINANIDASPVLERLGLEFTVAIAKSSKEKNILSRLASIKEINV